MTRRRWMILMLACVVLLGAIVLVLLHQTAEPVVQGRRLSQWVNDLWPTTFARPQTPVLPVQIRGLGTLSLTAAQARVTAPAPRTFTSARVVAGDPAKHSTAAKAIRELGTNAIPHLLPSIYSRDGKFKTWCVKWARKQNALKIRSAEEKRGQALSAMSALGAQALWAWVEIVTNDLADPEVQVYAARHLSTFGQEATPALPVLLTMDGHREPRAWSAISWAIQQCDRKGVLPALRNLRHSPDFELRASAAWSLGFIGDFPDIAIPALASALRDSSAKVREEALLSLAKYGTNAAMTANVVGRLINDPEPGVREAATNALQRLTASDANTDYKGPEAL